MSTTQHLNSPIGTETRSRGRWLALGVLVLAVLLVAVDATVLGLATPHSPKTSSRPAPSCCG